MNVTEGLIRRLNRRQSEDNDSVARNKLSGSAKCGQTDLSQTPLFCVYGQGVFVYTCVCLAFQWCCYSCLDSCFLTLALSLPTRRDGQQPPPWRRADRNSSQEVELPNISQFLHHVLYLEGERLSFPRDLVFSGILRLLHSYKNKILKNVSWKYLPSLKIASVDNLPSDDKI